MDLIEILKDMPKGTKLYSPAFGEVTFKKAAGNIIVVDDSCNIERVFFSDGKFYKDSECVLFPSKDNRDWNTFNKFDINTLKPFDRVLVRDTDNGHWKAGLYSNYVNNNAEFSYECVGSFYTQCIPYNDDTKHLVGTKEGCPKYYKTWE